MRERRSFVKTQGHTLAFFRGIRMIKNKKRRHSITPVLHHNFREDCHVARTSKRSLTKRYKREIIIDDVKSHIARGEFGPGERILPIRDLCTTYDLSLRVVSEALVEMVDQGILVRKPNIGYFVSDAAPGICARETGIDSGRPAARAGALSGGALNRFLAPLSTNAVLTLYVSEIHPRRLAVWQDTADAFAREHGVKVEMLSCHDGHPEEVLRTRRVDVIDLERKILLGRAAEFLPITDLSLVGLSDGDLLAPVREWIAAHSPLAGVPHTLTAQYLYINRTLAREAGLVTPPESLAQMIANAAAFERSRSEENMLGIVPMTVAEMLVSAGAIRAKPGSAEWVVDDALALETLKAIAGLPRRGLWMVGQEATVDAFIEGRMLYLPHNSYLPPFFRKNDRLDWQAVPLPIGRNGVSWASLLCLAINRSTPDPDACLSLIRALCAADMQDRLAEIGGNLPVRTASAFGSAARAQAPMSEALLRKVVERSQVAFPGANDGDTFQRQSTRFFGPLTTGELDPAEALSRLKFLLSAG